MEKHSLLDQWLAAEEAQTAMRKRGPGLASREQALALDGLAFMQAILSGELPYAHIAKTLDFTLIEVSKGRAVFQGTPKVAHLNPLGIVDGGWFLTHRELIKSKTQAHHA